MKNLMSIPLRNGCMMYKNDILQRLLQLKNVFKNSCQLCSTNSSDNQVITRRNALFNQEAKRQLEAIGRIEKICVQYKGDPEDYSLTMNKNISTPYNCAQHMNEMLIRRSALALINGTTLWDMHRPLESDCELQLLHFQDENPHHLNKAFWRSCSFILGYVATTAFKDNIEIILHSFPWPNVRSGSFVYDVEMPSLDNWNPTLDELKILSAEMIKIVNARLPIERLTISEELASEMFADNKHKISQIPTILSSSGENRITVYRVGKHIDISRGPMIGNSNFIGRCTVASVHKLETDKGNFYRFQGVALPKSIMLNHYAFTVIEQRAKKLNKGKLPWEYETDAFHPVRQIMEAVA